MLEEAGFHDVRIGPPVDTFADAGGEEKARAFDVSGYAFYARRT
jgi:arsenite methyltransferase